MKKRVVAFCTALALMAGVLALQVYDSLEQPTVVEMHASLRQSFDSLEELTSEASLIVVGEVVASTPTPYENVPFTTSTFKVRQVIKGDVKATDALSVLETGGQWKGKPKGTTKATLTSQELALEGIPVMKTGEKYLLFLMPYTGPVASNAYIAVGEFQGKFKISPKGTIEFSGNKHDAASPMFVVHQAIAGRTDAEVAADVRQLIRP